MEKKSVILYLNAIEQWEMLSNEQAGVLIKALLHYSITGEPLKTSDGMLKMAFSFMAAQIDRDSEKWEKTCEKRREAVNKRWNTKNTNVCNSIQMNTNDTDNDNVNDNVNDKDIIINNNKSSCNSEYVETHARPKKFVKPSLDQVKAYCKERNSRVNAERFYSYYESNGWKVGKNSMKDWKAAVRNWETNGYKNDVASDLGEDADKYYRVAMEAAKRDREETEQQFQEMRGGYYG